MKDSTGMGSVWTLPPTSGPIGGWQRERGPPLVALCAWHSRKLGMLLPHPLCTPLALAAVFQDLQGLGEGWVTAPQPPETPLWLPGPAAGVRCAPSLC